MTANRNSQIGIVAAIVVTAVFSSIVMFQGSTYHNDATNNTNELVLSDGHLIRQLNLKT